MLSPARWCSVVFALGLWLACACAGAQALAPIPSLDSPVVDTTGTLDALARQNLEAQARALQQRKGSQLQVLVVPTTEPEDIAAYSVRAFEQWKLGRKGVDDGVLLVVAKDDRRVRIEVGYGLEGAIPDATSIRVIQEYLVPKFRANDYAGGIADATAALVRLIDGEPLPAPMVEAPAPGNGGGDWLFALFAAFIVAQVARGIFGRAPSMLRGVAGAAAAGGVAWLVSSLLLVAKDDRRVRIEVGYGLEGAIPDATSIRVIQEYLVPKFRANDYAGGITDATAALVRLIDGEPLPAPMVEAPAQGKGGGDWLFALFAAFIVAQVARGIFGRAPSMVRGVAGAAAAGGVAWLVSSLLLVGGIGAAIGFFTGLASLPSGRFARSAHRGNGGWGGFGGGGWGGGGGGGGLGGGGWSGGGGMSGGGGASGSW